MKHKKNHNVLFISIQYSYIEHLIMYKGQSYVLGNIREYRNTINYTGYHTVLEWPWKYKQWYRGPQENTRTANQNNWGSS